MGVVNWAWSCYHVTLLQLMSGSGKGGSGQKNKLEPRTIDAYWLQREIKKFVNDPLVSIVLINAQWCTCSVYSFQLKPMLHFLHVINVCIIIV